jgi:putative hydrolase of the HAD superfamily
LEKSEVKVVTFDLDNTIWKTSAVINHANDELAKYLDSLGIKAPVRVENIMGLLFKSNKSKYCPLQAKENGNKNMDHIKAPVLLTQLRKDAIMEILRNQTTPLDKDLDNLTDEAFAFWANARHEAISSHLASSAADTLNQIRQLRTSSGKRVVVGAITDGNSDPRYVDILADHFDFVVNAESVGISKPDRRVYDAAIRRVCSNEELNHVFDRICCDDIDRLMDMLGPWWVHVGDDFVKDIVAAKDLKMRCIWSRELVLDKNPQIDQKTQATRDQSEDDLRQKIAEGKVTRMIIGTDNYLTETIFEEFSDAIVDKFSHVANVISSWHSEGIEAKESESIEVVRQDSTFTTIQEQKTMQSTRSIGIRNDLKYCMDCGEQLPLKAKFCFKCGVEQSA